MTPPIRAMPWNAMPESEQQPRSTHGSADSPREALLRAATKLFGERGPAAVSTREIAAAAGVNSGLIHRHFRTKDALLGEVLDRLAREISSVEEEVGPGANLVRFFYATRERTVYWNLLARCVLDGVPLDRIQSEYPTVSRMVVLVRRMQEEGWGPQGADPRHLAMLLTAMALGWLVFEPWLLRAADLDGDDREATRREFLSTAAKLLDLPRAPSAATGKDGTAPPPVSPGPKRRRGTSRSTSR